MIYDIRLKGFYTTTIIAVLFVVSVILTFGLTQKAHIRILSGIFAVFISTLSLLSAAGNLPYVIFSGITLPYQTPLEKFKISQDYNLEVIDNGSFLGCGQDLIITESKFILFDKAVIPKFNLCTENIYKIETKKMTKKNISLQIYHDGVDQRNPCEYVKEIK
ncbi:hypothetical protein ACFQ0I_15970 [Mariniflexile aquimaris]|uniref:Uncharacterized protein n=1 Tax=Mariniflexile aquimaris TaxID=881009 RepID=A0ABW3BYS9_9FLAO